MYVDIPYIRLYIHKSCMYVDIPCIKVFMYVDIPCIRVYIHKSTHVIERESVLLCV